ncbi:MAG: sigma-54-dependent Fis family transcriptional regulator [Magnetospirillum sp.]|nr:sigma-54-dependent Fis family transcriptional regulator [Magnetospirillum sp.]
MARDAIGRSLATGDDRAVMIAWEKFLSGDGMPHDAVRRMIEDSWRRCLEQGVNPIRVAAPLAVDGDGLRSLQHRHSDLIEAAKPVMAQAREFLAESGTMMILTDPTGVILWVEGDPGAKDNGQGIQLVPGALWDEAVSGTNAIGTALASGQPVQICAAEHFCEGIKHWTCSASVVRDPYDAQILGALDISGLSGSHNTHCLALALACAGRIETRLAALEMEKRARLLDVTLTRAKRWGDNGLVIFDRRGRLVRANENAGLFLDSLGLDLATWRNIGIDGLVDGVSDRRHPLPEWMQNDWLEPVIDHEERLGTILAIPLSRRWTSMAAVSQPKPEGRPLADPIDGIVGNSSALAKVKSRARQLARIHVPVLLLGPTGAGKEVFAQALHRAGPKASAPFVPLNCGSMTRDLLASELFGYVEGAFTGARRGGMAGKFEAADGGTLFLDEIGEMPLDLQAHFLRVLEEGEVYRLGENKARKVQVRVLAATNRDLRAEVAAGNFRMDLYYRLAVTVLRLPALAEHKDDIPLLIRHFVDQTARSYGVPAKYPTAEVMDVLMGYPWPGNVRELRNVIEGMVLLAEEDILTSDDLPPEFVAPAVSSASGALVDAPPPAEKSGRLADSERQAIIAAIRAENGNFTRAATRLGIAKSTLYEKMKRYGIDRLSAGGGTATV